MQPTPTSFFHDGAGGCSLRRGGFNPCPAGEKAGQGGLGTDAYPQPVPALVPPPEQPRVMSGIQPEDGSPPYRNWTSGSELNETREAVLTPSSDYDDEEFLRYLWKEYLHPKEYEWALIAGYIVVFIVALVGNVLVCLAVWKNHHMRTVTNYFIVNLSLADILVTITCLPATLVVDITETWFFGQTLCKVIPYLQTVSVSVSVLTLSCIALDRWYAICHPLMFKSTAKRARNSIIIIWIVSCIIMIPQAIVMECSSVFPGLANKTTLFTVCDEHWGAEVYPKMYHMCFFLVTYMAPLCLMVLAYLQIFRKLWCRQIPGTSSVVQKKWKPQQPSAQPRGLGQSTKSKISAVAAEIKQIRARRKTARMLMVVLLVFALCYLPISILNVLKRVLGMFNHADDRETVYAWFTFSHWLVYANSAANPIIYNFLSGKFREEFKAAFSCCIFGIGSHHDERFTRGRASTESRKSLTTQISNFDNVSKLSEHVVLTNINTIPSNGTASITHYIPAMLSPLKSAELHLHIPGMNMTSNIDEAMRVSAEEKTENAEWDKFVPSITKLTSMELQQG
ncbi:orexin receptor type 2 isoform X1 [Catharus ustulatus]|uniref:orexin receptor type 2 isoform X1 n=1 Tax=Catharus ustulatus TaxID=91951 RepID=UPI0014092E40|nr:orexin receptor type 2 isoform X1 [Catharus ustulatus]